MIEQLAARGALERLPPAIRDAPELREHLALYYGAFWDLDSCRTIGMGEGPITWLSIDAYATARGFDTEQRSDLHYFVSALDNAYLKHLGEKREKERKRGGKAQSGVVRPKNPPDGKGHRARGR